LIIFFFILAEIDNNKDDKIEKEASSSLFNNMNISTPIRLFGQFKQNGNGFSNFGQLSSTNGNNSSPPTTTTTTSYFTSTISKISSTNGTGGFGSSSTSLAASLAPLRYKIMKFNQ